MDRPRMVLAGVVAALLGLSMAFVLPFLDYFLLAVLLAYILRPIQRHAGARVGDRFAAGGIVLLAAVTIVVPTIFLVRTAVEQARRLLSAVRAGEVGFGAVESFLGEVLGVKVDVSRVIQAAVENLGVTALDDLVSIVGTLAHVLVGIGLTLFLLYYFLKDGDRFLAWLDRRIPLRSHVRSALYAEIRNITRAVLAGHVLVAIVQGILAGIGLLAVGIPNAAFWTIVMVVLAVLPIIGSFLVWGPAVGWLAIAGQPVAALTLLVYGTVVVGVSDDYLRPIVVDRYARVNPAVVIVGVLGGIYVIGFMGIFFGPVVIGALKAAIDLYDRELAAAGG